MSPTQVRFNYGQATVTLETGEIARQADGAVMIDMDGTVLLVTAVALKQADASRDFFPLTVHYQERAYAGGQIPGGFFKREGRPSEREILSSRLIDRPLRPLFPEGFNHEVQIIATLLSLNPEVDPDVPAMLGASAALMLAGIPFQGPIGAARVGYVQGQFLLNPATSQMSGSELDLMVAGTRDAVLMVESEASELSEAVMLDAVVFGHTQMQAAITAINDLASQAAKPHWNWQPPELAGNLQADMERVTGEGLRQAYRIVDKLARQEQVAALRNQAVAQLSGGEAAYSAEAVRSAFGKLEEHIVRSRILAHEPRIDGRDHHTVRPIRIRTGVLPRTHGSALFTRGETQALVVTTLGTERDAQTQDGLIEGNRKSNFMLHYNFPPYSVGEVGMVGSPKRREIGHGRLAKRGLQAVMPSLGKDFPYVVRVVSEVTESNGSSSMATVCGSSLSMMDAGVPLKAPVAGVAMGLIKEGTQFAVLTDIMGDEDHLGDMDFKVAGSARGVTALQMDIKINGITREIMQIALSQARTARLHILEQMNIALSDARKALSDFAPTILTMKINPDKIRDVIGKGGVTIRTLTEETGAVIDISDDGTIKIAAVERKAGEEAKRRIALLTAEVAVGQIYEGRVTRLMDFGAFVTILPGRDGLVHISQLSEERVQNVSDKLAEGDIVRVKVLEIDKQGRIRLSMKAVGAEESTNAG